MFSKVKEMSQNTQMKRTAEEAQLSTEAVTAPTKKSKATKAKGPWMPTEFDANGNPVSIVMEKDRAGELIPKAKIAGQEESNFVAQFNTPAMTVQFNDLKQGGWSPEEDEILWNGHKQHGNKWTEIAKMVGGRTDNAVKNRHAVLVKKEEDRLAGGGAGVRVSVIRRRGRRR